MQMQLLAGLIGLLLMWTDILALSHAAASPRLQKQPCCSPFTAACPPAMSRGRPPVAFKPFLPRSRELQTLLCAGGFRNNGSGLLGRLFQVAEAEAEAAEAQVAVAALQPAATCHAKWVPSAAITPGRTCAEFGSVPGHSEAVPTHRFATVLLIWSAATNSGVSVS